jgi:hypothetical protein
MAAVTSAGVAVHRMRTPEQPAAVGATAAATPSLAEPASPQAETTVVPAVAAPVPAPLAPSNPRKARPRGHSIESPSRVDLGDEIASLDRAREALAHGDASRALALVDEYAKEFPGGVLGQEATVVRIEALLARGDRKAADGLARRLLAAHPASPHAARVRALLAGASNL